jgi:hypothetical protein
LCPIKQAVQSNISGPADWMQATTGCLGKHDWVDFLMTKTLSIAVFSAFLSMFMIATKPIKTLNFFEI